MTFIVFLLLAVHSFANGCPDLSQYEKLILEPQQIPKNNTWKKYGQSFDEFYGVQAFSNHEDGKGGTYQCTELVHRFMREVYGVPTRIGMGLGHAKDLAKNLSVKFPTASPKHPSLLNKKISFFYFDKNCLGAEPDVGSLVSFKSPPYGHIAIVRNKTIIDDNTFDLYLFEQHGELNFKLNQIKPVRKLRIHKGKYPQNIKGWLVPYRLKAE